MNSKIVLIILGILLILPLVSASGFIVPIYDDGNPLKLMPGESAIVDIELQNMVSEQDQLVKPSLLTGAAIASIKSEYSLPQRSILKIPVKVAIPSDMPLGTKEDITIEFGFFNVGSQPGMIEMGTALTVKFPVLVSETSTAPEQPSRPIIPEGFSAIQYALIIAIVACAIAAYRIYPRKKQ